MITPKMRRRVDILLVDDGSPRFLDAVKLLQDLPISRAALPKSSVLLYGIVEPNQSFDLLVRETVLEQAKDSLAEKGLGVETRLLIGDPAERLVEISREIKPDLVMLGTNRRLASHRGLLDWPAEEVVRQLGRPLLIIRAPYSGLRRILAVASEPDLCAVSYLSKFPLPLRVTVQVVDLLSLMPVTNSPRRSQIFGPDAFVQHRSSPRNPAKFGNEPWNWRAPIQRAIQMLSDERIEAAHLPGTGDGQGTVEVLKSVPFDMAVMDLGSLNRLKETWIKDRKSAFPLNHKCAVMVVQGKPQPCSEASF